MLSKKKIYPKIVPLNLGELIVNWCIDSAMSFQISKRELQPLPNVHYRQKKACISHTQINLYLELR